MDNLFEPVATRLLDCFRTQLEAMPAGLVPARIGFRFDDNDPTMGIALHEDECKCGTAWVRIADWFITSNGAFPGQDDSIEEHRCPAAWGLVLDLGIGRCPPTGDQRQLPTVAERDAFFRLLLDDAAVMRQTIFCCFKDVEDSLINIGQPRRIGPQGACMEQVLPITVMVIACDECTPG